MTRIDISRLLPQSVLTYLTAIVPGAFLEISILLGNPHIIHIATARARGVLGYYSCLVVALLLAFVIGNGFMWLASFVQELIRRAYRTKAFLWRKGSQFFLRAALPGITKLAGPAPRPWIARLLGLAHRRLSPPFAAIREVEACLHDAASALLKQRYGIQQVQSRRWDWGVWYSVLAEPTKREKPGWIMATMTQATGWCGLTAAYFAPQLRARPYVAFSLALILFDVLHNWAAAKRIFDPVPGGLFRIKRILTHMRESAKDGGQANLGDGEA